MQSTACVFQFPHGRQLATAKPQVERTVATIPALAPRLEWIARVRGVDPVALVDVAGKAAFERAGLYAFAKPSDRVRLFVFAPDASSCGSYRYEGWLVQPGEEGRVMRLAVPLVATGWQVGRDAVDAMTACEAAARYALCRLAGDLAW